MANNRMFLVVGDERICLAKYYPSRGWYIRHTEEEMNDWFSKHTITGTQHGDMRVRLEYETLDDFTSCPSCGGLLEKRVERDEKSNGAALGEAVWTCQSCGEWFDEEELSTLTENKS